MIGRWQYRDEDIGCIDPVNRCRSLKGLVTDYFEDVEKISHMKGNEFLNTL